MNEVVTLGVTTGFGNDMLKLGFIKLFIDGSLGARTAALNDPYTDKSDTNGLLITSQRVLRKLFLTAQKAKLQLAIHAIGDRAIETVLNAFSKLYENGYRNNLRHRIEHCSVLNKGLIARTQKLGFIVSVQPHFVASDVWILDRLGEKRARWTYPFKTLLTRGLTVASGSDHPVEPLEPLFGIWAAVTRSTFPEENLSVKEALTTYTENAAYASFDETKKGTIEPGKFADFTILSKNPLEVPPEQITDIEVELVIVDGRIVYDRVGLSLS
jgi:predicted amidohydrolase YtcJ